MVRKSRSRSRSRSKERSHHKHHKYHRSQKTSHKRSRSRSPKQRSKSPRQRSRSPKSSKYRSTKKSLSPLSTSKTIDSLTLGGGLTLGNVKPKINLTSMAPILDPQTLEGKTNEEIEMIKLLGFSTFDTTKGKHVDGSCNASGANIQQKRRYRQYMNRKGGFNRPLDPIA